MNLLNDVKAWIHLNNIPLLRVFVNNDSANSIPTNVTASVLPTGAATETKQDTGNTSLSSIDTKLTDNSQRTRIAGGTDQTQIGNTGDRLKVESDGSTISAGLEVSLTLTAGQTVELKIGATAKADRKYIKILAKGNSIKFGFSNPAATFDALNNQLLLLPYGASTQVFVTNSSGGNRSVILGEV